MTSGIGAGDLHERVAFDAPTGPVDGYGGVETGWGIDADAVKVRAHYRYLRGGETVQAARLQGTQVVVVTVRNAAATRAVTADWRLRDQTTGQVFNIRSPAAVSEDRAFLEFTCETGVAV